jgi:hypothetical protein
MFNWTIFGIIWRYLPDCYLCLFRKKSRTKGDNLKLNVVVNFIDFHKKLTEGQISTATYRYNRKKCETNYTLVEVYVKLTCKLHHKKTLNHTSFLGTSVV